MVHNPICMEVLMLQTCIGLIALNIGTGSTAMTMRSQNL